MTLEINGQTITGASVINLYENLVPKEKAYRPLDGDGYIMELRLVLKAEAQTDSISAIFAQLLPFTKEDSISKIAIGSYFSEQYKSIINAEYFEADNDIVNIDNGGNIIIIFDKEEDAE